MNEEPTYEQKLASAQSGAEVRELAREMPVPSNSAVGGPDFLPQQHGEPHDPIPPPPGTPGPSDGNTASGVPASTSLEHETDPVLIRKAAASLRRHGRRA
jgi:hypothetical protein